MIRRTVSTTVAISVFACFATIFAIVVGLLTLNCQHNHISRSEQTDLVSMYIIHGNDTVFKADSVKITGVRGGTFHLMHKDSTVQTVTTNDSVVIIYPTR